VKHIIIASVLVVVFTVVAIVFMHALQLVPPLASAEGEFVDQMFTVQLYFIAFFFSLIVVFMIYSIVVFRRKPGDTSEGPNIKGSTALETVWTIVPLIIVMGLGIWGAGQLTEITASEPEELVVEVTGFQFGWRFDYPDYGISSSELLLPRGRQVLFRITSTDVIHSFWVPEFRIKQDAVPGRWTNLRVTPTEVGDFRIRCAEMCGYAHSAMYAPVVVVEPEEFDSWIAGQDIAVTSSEDLTPTELGAKLSEEQGCLSCHSIDGSPLVGPTWLSLFGSERQLENGDTVVADEEYLRTSILEPQNQVVAEYPNVMPAAYNFLSEEELDAIIEYIQTLGE
jgi:cytochrome c oxidase subunit 2